MFNKAKMHCPKCDALMEHIHHPLADYERCSSCKGLWLDRLEHKDLKNVADSIDIGEPAVAKDYNDKHKVNCPVCPNTQMLRMVDPGQPHIWFEQCSSCQGRFYDAGEFKDVSEYTISDFFKKLFIKERL